MARRPSQNSNRTPPAESEQVGSASPQAQPSYQPQSEQPEAPVWATNLQQAINRLIEITAQNLTQN